MLRRSLIDSIADASVAISTGDRIASGVFLDIGQTQSLVLTCWHAFRKPGTVSVAYKNAQQSVFKTKGKLIAWDSDDDLALLGLPIARSPFSLQLSSNPPEAKEELCVAGSPNDFFGIADEARYQGKAKFDEQKIRYLITTNGIVVGGISGGPVANSHGQLVGILVSGPADDELPLYSFGFAVPLPTIKRFLSQVQKGHAKQALK